MTVTMEFGNKVIGLIDLRARKWKQKFKSWGMAAVA